MVENVYFKMITAVADFIKLLRNTIGPIKMAVVKMQSQAAVTEYVNVCCSTL